MQSLRPISVFLRFYGSPAEDLDVATALTRQADAVREVLLNAIRLVPLSDTDITLLWIESQFQSALKSRWREPHNLRLVLASCHQGKIVNRTERLFFQHGKDWGIVLLGLGTRANGHRLFREIDTLSDEALIKLVENVTRFSKTIAINTFLEEIGKSVPGVLLYVRG